jgi:succinyl-diaminopimelate desuccinylase
MDIDKIGTWLQDQQTAMIDLQSELTVRPALGPENGGVGEWEKARFLEQYLRQHGLEEIDHYDCPDSRVPEGSRPNLALTVRGSHEEPCVWVLTHLDVVPPGEQEPDGTWRGWESDPYVVRQAGDLIVGRGVVDNQQSMVASVFALRGLLENGTKPAHTVKLLFVADEETNSDCGLRYVLREFRSLFSADDAIIVPDAGSEDGSMIEIAEKSLLWLEFRVHGKQGHASRPDVAVNAFRGASQMACLLDDTLRSQFDKIDHLFTPSCSTFEPTLHQANVPNVNTIPAEDVFCFDCRVLPPYDLDAVLDLAMAQCRQVDRRIGTTTEVKVRARQDAPPATPPDAPVVKMLQPAIQEVYNVKPQTMGIGGQTVASPFREAGLSAAVWMSGMSTAHQVNEVCSVPHMVGDAQVFARVFRTAF